MKIYCLEDDDNIRELVLYSLRNSGYEALGFSEPSDFYEAIQTEKLPDMVLLDIMLPEENGLSVLQKLRKTVLTKDLPVILLTAKGSEFDKIQGLDSGADDYIAKPFGVMELISRIKAVLRRYQPLLTDADKELIVGNIRMNIEKHQVFADEQLIELTYKEFEMLQCFLEHPGIVYTRDKLLERVWGYEFDGETRTVDVHIRTLRQKVDPKGKHIQTVRGVGYRMEEPK